MCQHIILEEVYCIVSFAFKQGKLFKQLKIGKERKLNLLFDKILLLVLKFIDKNKIKNKKFLILLHHNANHKTQWKFL